VGGLLALMLIAAAVVYYVRRRMNMKSPFEQWQEVYGEKTPGFVENYNIKKGTPLHVQKIECVCWPVSYLVHDPEIMC
jgi:hypothetical protein